jgi:GntR family transcriptional regulator, transcriptional repressor for pyruvate dehydrogenase complex
VSGRSMVNPGARLSVNLRPRKATDPKGTASEVIQRIRSLIEERGLHPGMRLPPERVLAAVLKVGRPAVREAIKALSMLEVLESRHGDGTYIRSLSGLSVGWPTRVILRQENFSLMSLWEVRKMFEPQAASLAAARATEDHLREMEQELAAQQRYSNDYDRFAKHDYLFHDGILRAAGNPILSDLSRFLAPLLLKSRRVTVRTTEDLTKIIAQHWKVFEAIRIGHAELAEFAMRQHLQIVGLDLISEAKR